MHDLAMMAGLSLDSLLASFVLGLRAPRSPVTWSLPAAFGLCDGAASLFGALLPHSLPEPPACALYLLCALCVALASRARRPLILLLPGLLSIDNLWCGVSPRAAPLFALASAALSAAGLALAWGVRWAVKVRNEEVAWVCSCMRIIGSWVRTVRRPSWRRLSTRTRPMHPGGGTTWRPKPLS